ncbi:hypothetical protein [Spirosoma pollinicola]|uniref:Outer membrane protein beta-barrel domain-containing protein n=1 Tax=Spirosoma pollinicola TaxID=2057025 RepID=A0A2K8YV75_9BACT|nr:hypothetical protein [Spirosoma pollinicola]AUD01521.1 hypothetical protein CWM47_06655 [Spirosoma pollinicola]
MHWAVFAQPDADFYKSTARQPTSGVGFRVGLNYSKPAVTSAVVVASPSTATSYLGGVEPQFGYYIGAYLYHDLRPNQFTFRLDATVQAQVARAAYNGKTVANPSYYYLGMTPLVGLHLTNNLTIYTGPEVNLQVARRGSWGKGYPLEVGVNMRFTYSFGRFGAEVGYFRGFTKIDRFELYNLPGGPAINDIYNQNMQAGILYKLGR